MKKLIFYFVVAIGVSILLLPVGLKVCRYNTMGENYFGDAPSDVIIQNILFFLGVLIVIAAISYELTRKQKCEYPLSFDSYCNKPATKLHMPNQSYSCDEHSEYFRSKNDKTINL
jgi:hypothetical protein